VFWVYEVARESCQVLIFAVGGPNSPTKKEVSIVLDALLNELLSDACKTRTPRVEELRKAYFKAMPEICIERPELMTRFCLKNNLFGGDHVSILDKARMYRYILEEREERKPVVYHRKGYERQKNGEEPKSFDIKANNLFAGSTTSKFKGVPLYPEFSVAMLLWPELWTISTRESNPFQISKSEVEKLNYDIFPHWMKDNVLEIARKRCFEENLKKYNRKKYAPELNMFHQLVFFMPSKAGCVSHTIPYLSRAINEGFRAIINEANAKAEESSDTSQREFYQALAEALEGIIGFSKNLAVEAERMAKKEKDLTLKKELLEIAKINRHVPEYPARSFREGLTTVWICWIAIHTENINYALSTGRMDQYLYRLYQRDVENGTLTVKDAIELLCCLWLKIGDHVPAVPDASEQLFGGTGSNQAITIGGVDENGDDAVNELTYIILRSIELMKLRDPNLNARYYPSINSDKYLEEICKTNINTGATPAIHNDRAVIKSLKEKYIQAGIESDKSEEYARDYGIIGCVEPASNGRAYVHSASILLNLASVLELALFNGKHRHTKDEQISEKTGEPNAFRSFENFRNAFEKQLRWMAKQTTNLNNILGRVCQDFQPTPILSSLFEGPMEKGKCLEDGGAIINSSGVTIIGFADVADSLTAIQKVIYGENQETFEKLLDALRNEFSGCEVLRSMLLSAPKYGTGDEMADENARWVADLLDDVYGNIENYRGGHYMVGYWTMTNHAGFGRLMGSSPSGRMKGENFASGITPVSRSVYGDKSPLLLMDTLNSVASLRSTSLSSGIALNLKYVPDDGKDMLNYFVSYVKAYFDDRDGTQDGGMEIQFNVTDHGKFIEAVNDPKQYNELLVRVSGYTAYFKDLNPQMQKEIIDRTEYRLSTGRMVYYDPYIIPEKTV
jgi:pyruvate-formate lyase